MENIKIAGFAFETRGIAPRVHECFKYLPRGVFSSKVESAFAAPSPDITILLRINLWSRPFSQFSWPINSKWRDSSCGGGKVSQRNIQFLPNTKMFGTYSIFPLDQWNEGLEQLRDWVADGKLVAEETVV